MRDVLSRMALVLEGQTALLFRLARAWINAPIRRRRHRRGFSRQPRNSASAKRVSRLWQRRWRCWAASGTARRVNSPAVSRDAGEQHLGRLREHHVSGCSARSGEAAGYVRSAGRGFCAGERSGQTLRSQLAAVAAKLRKPQEAQGREIAHQLFLLGAGSQMLRHASPPVAQAWCRMMLDTRGGTLMTEQVQSDLLLRATGRVGWFLSWNRLTS